MWGEDSTMILCGLRNVKYLLSGALQKKFANP